MRTRAEEDLATIRRLLEEGRQAVVDRGLHFMIWGAVPASGLVATYVKASTGAGPDPRWVWAALLVVGWMLSFVVGWRAGRGARVSTLASRLLTATWVSAGVSLTLIALAGMFSGLVGAPALPGLLAAVIGAPILTTSLLTGQRWLAWVAAGWWIGGGVMLFVPGIYSLLLMAVMAVVLMMVPGAVLWVRSRRSPSMERAGDTA